jgi:NAD(P)-dependent dehydrogenase (short-subunit alcohol dehydrogenase family)
MRAVITGANRGIGLELARQLRDKGWTVHAACRSTSEELDALDVDVIEGVDVGTEQGVNRLSERIEGKVDLLINNAGILSRQSLDELDWSGIEHQFQVNAMGPLRVTSALLNRLETGSKVAIITSRMGSMSDNSSGSHYGYRMSKAAVNAAGVSLARDLAPRRIPVLMLHPGYVRTRMTGLNGNWGPAEAASGLLDRIDELTMPTSGRFWHADGTELPW